MNLVSACAAAATVGVLTAVVAQAAPRWTAGAQDRATVVELQLMLREAQQRAVGESQAMCVERMPTAGRWTVQVGECAADSDGVTAGVTFYADGSATDRTIRIGADTVRVDGRTGRITAS